MAKSTVPSSDPKALLEERFRSGELTFDELREELANLDAGAFDCEVGKAGGLVLKFPNGRFPVNFFYEWARAVFFNPEAITRIKEFMEEHKKEFKTKDDRREERKSR
jgi:hypothetical protein